MDADTWEKAAFLTSRSLYEWTVMPFSLCNAPSTFARLMELVLKGLHWKICLIYLDDVIVMGCTFEEELEQLKEMFEQLARAGLQLKPKKCFLFEKPCFVPWICGQRERYCCRTRIGGATLHQAHHRDKKFPWTCLLLPPIHPCFLNHM